MTTPSDKALHAKLQAQIDAARKRLPSPPVTSEAPAPGDLYLLEETAAFGIEWFLISPHPEDATRFLAVPADSLPLVGTKDLKASDDGRLVLRCAHPVWLPIWHLEATRRTRRFDSEIAQRAGLHEAAVRAGEEAQWSDLQEVDTDPEYRAWSADLERGRHCLITVLAYKQPIYQQILAETALRLYVNGIDGESGRYHQAPLPTVVAATRARGETWDPHVRQLLDQVDLRNRQAFLGLPSGADPLRLSQTGWGIVFSKNAPPELRDALAPLIRHRRDSAGELFHTMEYRPGESWREWLARHGVAAGDDVDPRRVPYYLLLVGSPKEIPYEFEQLLGIEYAVGRLSFDGEDEPLEALRRYALSVVKQEERDSSETTPEAVFFAPRHPDDPLTLLTADQLMLPLMEDLEGIETRRLWGADATRSALREAFTRPASRLLVAAAHGLGQTSGHPYQRARQGALLCQDWTGGAVDEEHLFSAATLDRDLQVEGTVALLFASFGAGTPEYDTLNQEPGVDAPRLAPSAFTARLPQRLLAHENGSALAVIGLADRAWGYALATAAESSTRPLRKVVEGLTKGQPVGYAAQAFNESHAAVTADLGKMLEKARFGGMVDSGRLVQAWVERNHSQSWVVVGDPAVRLAC